MILDSGYVIGATGPRAMALFVKRYGYAPARCFRSGRWRWLAGPVDDENARRGRSGAGRDHVTMPIAR